MKIPPVLLELLATATRGDAYTNLQTGLAAVAGALVVAWFVLIASRDR